MIFLLFGRFWSVAIKISIFVFFYSFLPTDFLSRKLHECVNCTKLLGGKATLLITFESPSSQYMSTCFCIIQSKNNVYGCIFYYNIGAELADRRRTSTLLADKVLYVFWIIQQANLYFIIRLIIIINDLVCTLLFHVPVPDPKSG